MVTGAQVMTRFITHPKPGTATHSRACLCTRCVDVMCACDGRNAGLQAVKGIVPLPRVESPPPGYVWRCARFIPSHHLTLQLMCWVGLGCVGAARRFDWRTRRSSEPSLSEQLAVWRARFAPPPAPATTTSAAAAAKRQPKAARDAALEAAAIAAPIKQALLVPAPLTTASLHFCWWSHSVCVLCVFLCVCAAQNQTHLEAYGQLPPSAHLQAAQGTSAAAATAPARAPALGLDGALLARDKEQDFLGRLHFPNRDVLFGPAAQTEMKNWFSAVHKRVMADIEVYAKQRSAQLGVALRRRSSIS